MPVSSPYALFRASDLLWPALHPAPLKRAGDAVLKAAPLRRWPAVIQGELFPPGAEGLSGRGSACRRSTARRASP